MALKEKNDVIAEYRTHEGDTGSPEVQIAILSNRIAHLTEHLKISTTLFMDETTAPALDPGRGQTETGYLRALARDDRSWGGDDPPGVLHFYAPDRRGENAGKFLKRFNGILQLDGYHGYNRLTRPDREGGEPSIVAHCWAHARRKLKEILDRDGSEIAAEGLRQIAELYAIEEDIRSTCPGQRLSARQARSAPLFGAFDTWLASPTPSALGCKSNAFGSRPNHAWAKSWPSSTVTGADCRHSCRTGASRSTPARSTIWSGRLL